LAAVVKGSPSGHQDISPFSSCSPGQKHFGSRLNTIRDVFVAVLLKFCQPQGKTEAELCYLIVQALSRLCLIAHIVSTLDSDKPYV